MPQVVCQGATCTCDNGQILVGLIVTSQTIVSVGGNPVATVRDCKSPTNLPLFGTCTLLTKTVPVVCKPALAPQWTAGSTIQTINGQAVLVANSTLRCAVGGTISITDPNNAIEQTN